MNAAIRTRRGSALLIVLVCVMLVTVSAGALLKGAMLERSRVRQAELRRQADWLAEAALNRAAARLAADGAYRGETWAIPAGELGGSRSASVRIEVEPLPDSERRFRIAVTADHPPDLPHRARSQRRIVVEKDDG